MGKIINTALLIFGVGAIVACADDGCTEEYISYNVGDAITSSASPNKIQSFDVFAPGVPADTLPQIQVTPSTSTSANTTTTSFQLKLNPATTSTEFLFTFYKVIEKTTINSNGQTVTISAIDTITDVVTFKYENQNFFIDADCGCTVYHFLDTVEYTTNIISQIEITNPEITNEAKPNFDLYY